MAFFIHNKYDKDSLAKVKKGSGLKYTYNSDPTVTVIDYYGQLENGNSSYKYLNTVSMGKSTISTLQYITIDTANLIGNTSTSDEKSSVLYVDGIIPILNSVQLKVGQPYDTGSTLADGSIMGKLNYIMSIIETLKYSFNKVIASNNQLAILSTTEVKAGSSASGTTNKTLSCKFFTDLTGTVRLTFTVKFPSDNGSGYVAILKEDLTQVGKTGTFSNSTFSSYGNITIDIPVEAGKTYYIYVYGHGSAGYSGTAYLKDVVIYGTYTVGPIEYIHIA